MQPDILARLPTLLLGAATAQASASPPRSVAQALRALVPPGAVVEARVLTLTAANATQAAYDVLLSIGGRTVTTTSPQALEVGARVWITNNAGQQLKILTAPPGLAKDRAVVEKITAQIDQALRNALPREQPAKPALRAMQQILGSRDPSLPDTTRQLLSDVFSRLPELTSARDPQRLPDLLRNSGVFLEHTLRQFVAGTARPAPFNDDLRVSLLRLAAHLQRRPPDAGDAVRPVIGGREAPLLDLVQGVLARMKVQQLSTLNSRLPNQADAPAVARMSLELPFLLGAQIESVQLAIGREEVAQRRRPATPSAWTADLDFDLGGLGALHVRARLQGAQLSATFWARDTTLALVKRHIASLRDELARHDVHLQHVAYQPGMPPARLAHPRPLLNVAI